MPEPGSISAFPWAALERVPRSAVRIWGRLQQSVATRAGQIDAPLAAALGRWLGAPVRFEWRSLHSGSDETQHELTRLRFRLDPGPIELALALDARLMMRLVARALNQVGTLYDGRPPLEPELLGAASAVVLHVIDAARLGIAVEFIEVPLEIPNAVCARLDAALHVDGASYRVCLEFTMSPLSACGAAQERSTSAPSFAIPGMQFASWARLGNIPVALPLVVGTSLVTRDVLEAFAPGRAFIPGSGLWVNAATTGHGVLIAPLSDHGVHVDLEPGDKIVLRGTKATLEHDEPTQTAALSPEVTNLTDALREAPVVLRVELGAVSLPARQWAELRVGDIVETGKPLGSAVVLRVAGQALAEGELLNIDGEIGVRITRLLTDDS